MNKISKNIIETILASTVMSSLIIITIILSGYLIYGWNLEGWYSLSENTVENDFYILGNSFTFLTLSIGCLVAVLLVRFSLLSYVLSYLILVVSMKLLIAEPLYFDLIKLWYYILVFIGSIYVLIPSFLMKLFFFTEEKIRYNIVKNYNKLFILGFLSMILFMSWFFIYTSIRISFFYGLELKTLIVVPFFIISGLMIWWCVKIVRNLLKDDIDFPWLFFEGVKIKWKEKELNK